MKINQADAKKIIDYLNDVPLIGSETPTFMQIVNTILQGLHTGSLITIPNDIANNAYVFMMRIKLEAAEAKTFVRIITAIEKSVTNNDDDEWPKAIEEPPVTEEIAAIDNNERPSEWPRPIEEPPVTEEIAAIDNNEELPITGDIS